MAHLALAKTTKKLFIKHIIDVLDHALSNPCPNIIKIVRNKMKKHQRNHSHHPSPELRVKLQDIWDIFAVNN